MSVRGVSDANVPPPVIGFLNHNASVAVSTANLGRHLVGAEHYRALRISAFNDWEVAVA